MRFNILSKDETLRQRQREFGKLALLAVFVGITAAVAAVLFRYLIEWVFSVAFAEPSELLDLSWDQRMWYAIVPAIGGLIAGPLIWYFAKEAK